MKIFICCSKAFYDLIPDIKAELEEAGHIITLPNSYDNPKREDEYRSLGQAEHANWKGQMIMEQKKKVNLNDAILVLNYTKNGQENYIGGATFLEMYEAYIQQKKIFLYNPVPDNILRDEILGFNPTVIRGDLSKIGI